MAGPTHAGLSVCHCSPSRCTKRLTLRRAPNQFALPITHRVHNRHRRHALNRPRTKTIVETTNAFPEINSNRPVVAGDRAILRNGIAYAPSRAPDNIKNAIWAVNTLRRKPYVWGGGHGSFNDYGYDCSGAVSFALHYAGLLDAPLPSNDFRRYGKRGRGRWITIYSRDGHTFAIIAGLRLDTTDMRDGGAVGPRWYADGRDTHGFDARHPAGW